jgi:rod shape-determining protein MreC
MINTKSMKRSGDISLNKKNNKLPKFLIGAIFILFLLFFLNFFNSGIKNIFYAFTNPNQKTFWSAGESCSGFLNSFVNAGSLNNENNNLKEENQKLLSQVALLQTLTGRSQAQSEIASVCQNNGFKILMAGVTGLDEQDMLSVNKGSADGISENMPVVNQQGALYGKIFKVYKNYSQVMLISNKNSVINVKIQQQTTTQADLTSLQSKEIDGVVRGKGGLVAYLDLVPIDDIINQNDVLVTSALEGIFPKDLLVGKITKVEKNDQNPHQQAEVQLFLDVSTDNLFVITNYKQTK